MMFVTPASPAMIVAIAPAFPITAFIRFTLISYRNHRDRQSVILLRATG